MKFFPLLNKLLVISIIGLLTSCFQSSQPDAECALSSYPEHPALKMSAAIPIAHKIFVDQPEAPHGEFHYELQHRFSEASHPITVKLNARIRFGRKTGKLIFVTSMKHGDQNSYWEGVEIKPGQAMRNDWHPVEIELKLPVNSVVNQQMTLYLWNPDNADIELDYYEVVVESQPSPSFMPKVTNPEAWGNSEILASTENYHIHYYPKDKAVVIADFNHKPLTRPIAWIVEYTFENETFQCTQLDWQLSPSSGNENPKTITLMGQSKHISIQMNLETGEDDAELMFHVKAGVSDSLTLHRLALNIQLEEKITRVFNKYGNEHSPANEEIHLPRGGFLSGIKYRTFSCYHNPDLSSIQLNTHNQQVTFNLDYQWDHPMIQFPLHPDSNDYFIDQSSSRWYPNDELTATIPVYIGREVTTLPRFLSVPGGYQAAILFTEHSDWTNMRTHRAVCYGHEDIQDPEAAEGGFVHYNIPVTKSVFYNNPDSADNTRASDSLFTELHTTIQTDDDFLPFLHNLAKSGFEICLHTPAQFTDSRASMKEALEFMKQEFDSPTWIDHGYNNPPINNRENLVCDGLNMDSPHYSRDLWEQNGIRYLWHPYYEDKPVYSKWGYSSHMLLPYPAFGIAFPFYPIAKHPNFAESLLWYTTSVAELPHETTWDYLYSTERLNDLVRHKGIFISHMYPAWVRSGKGFWLFDDHGKMVANPGMNRAMARIAEMRDERLILPTTVSALLGYYEAIQQVSYEISEPKKIMVTNNSKQPIQALSMAISSQQIKVNGETPEFKRQENELIFWFNLLAGETAVIEWL